MPSDHPPAGSSLCHCRTCERTFRNLTAFDAHQPDRRGCGDPTAAGLIERDGLWATPEGHSAAAALRQRLETVRAARRAGTQTDEQGRP